MYISISPQKLGDHYGSSAKDFISYLEKENSGKSLDQKTYFFNHQEHQITDKEVVKKIDANTAKLGKKIPKYYSVTLNPSQRELRHIKENPEKLKLLTRKIMEDYARCFNREIDGRPVSVSDIIYFAKIEHTRFYSEKDLQVRENMPYLKRIAKLKHDLVKIQKGELQESMSKANALIRKEINNAPHKLNGSLIDVGVQKPGPQSHIHIIVSRKDATNRYSLSPGSKYKNSTTMLNGKKVHRGFNRDLFYKKAELQFDKLFAYNRNYVESYTARKTLQKNPATYYRHMMGLPLTERKLAFKLMQQAGLIPKVANISPAQANRLLKIFKRAADLAIKSSSIQY
ncbi:MobB family relaxase [Salegentibacter flavus]|uniref:Mobilization protein n=1 Tax=Salegentibacter flavus TaxID=287099 RepID=A0A1I5CSP9_9FLAO|nr:MobB family relaxase [Salegentibacter flavus]SFN89947.1 hypothetical protein SAMN05660413_02988 [Salegentibacter flavus]